MDTDTKHPRQPVTCILPSNAPHTPDGSYLSLSSSSSSRRILQERCGNRRDQEIDVERKQKALELLKQTESEFIANLHQGKYMLLEVSDLHRIIKESRRLWDLLFKCVDFVLYRQRQPQDIESPGPSQRETKVWPDRSEVAFCRGLYCDYCTSQHANLRRALAAYPPIGRCKVSSDGDSKLRGRNELIADFIKVETGEHRHRKQVSSHIQVIKPYTANNPYVNAFLIAPPGHDAKQARRRYPAAGRQRQASAYSNTHQHPSRHMIKSEYRIDRYSDWSQQPLPCTAMSSNIFRSHYAGYIPDKFSMRIQDAASKKEDRVIHEFTSLRQIARLSPVIISDFQRLSISYPPLAGYSQEELLRTQIISADATIRLVDSKLPDNAELGIQLSLKNTASLGKYNDFECRASFYDNGQLLKFRVQEKDPEGKPTGQRYETTEISDRVEYDHSKNQLGNVHFGSDFWAYRLGLSMSELKKANSLLIRAMESDRDAAQKYEDLAKKAKSKLEEGFKSLTALQEISAKVQSTGRVERLLLICWRFEQCIDEGKCGETTWRDLIVNQNSTYCTAAIPGAMPYMSTSTKEEPFSQDAWTDNAMDIKPIHEDIATTLQQSFDPAYVYPLSDFATDSMRAIPTTATVEGQIASPLYNANHFDFTVGHVQLNLAQQLPASVVDLVDGFHQDNSANDNTGLLYDHTGQDWQDLQYSEPYYDIQAQQVEYNTIQTYDEYNDSPYSEAGAQQYPDSAIEMTSQQHKALPNALQHLFKAPPHIAMTPPFLIPEEASRQQATLEEPAVDHVLIPKHEDNVQDEKASIQADNDYPEDFGADRCRSEHALVESLSSLREP